MYRSQEDAARARADAAIEQWRVTVERLDRAYRRHDIVPRALAHEPVPENASADVVNALTERIVRETAELAALAARVEKTPIRRLPFGSRAVVVLALIGAWAFSLVVLYVMSQRSPGPWVLLAILQAVVLSGVGQVALAKSHVPRLKAHVPAAAKRSERHGPESGSRPKLAVGRSERR